MTTYFIYVDITHSCFGHDLTHVMLNCLSKLSGTTLVNINQVVIMVVLKKNPISDFKPLDDTLHPYIP